MCSYFVFSSALPAGDEKKKFKPPDTGATGFSLLETTIIIMIVAGPDGRQSTRKHGSGYPLPDIIIIVVIVIFITDEIL